MKEICFKNWNQANLSEGDIFSHKKNFGIQWSVKFKYVCCPSKGRKDISRIDRADNLQRTNVEDKNKMSKLNENIFPAPKMNFSLVYFAYLIEWKQGADLFFFFLQMYLFSQQHLHLCHTLAGLTFTLSRLQK